MYLLHPVPRLFSTSASTAPFPFHQLTAQVLAQLQEGLLGLGTQQQEAWLSEGLSEGS